nr:hypothetical protein [Dyella subtropica]
MPIERLVMADVVLGVSSVQTFSAFSVPDCPLGVVHVSAVVAVSAANAAPNGAEAASAIDSALANALRPGFFLRPLANSDATTNLPMALFHTSL